MDGGGGESYRRSKKKETVEREGDRGMWEVDRTVCFDGSGTMILSSCHRG